MTTEHRVANRTWVFYEKRSVGSSHKKERWVLPSKQNTLYKSIRLLELVPDGRKITWRQIYASGGEVRNETQSGVWCWGGQETKRRLGSEENRDMGPRSIRGGEGQKISWGTGNGKSSVVSLCQDHGHTISSLLHLPFAGTQCLCRQLNSRTRCGTVQWKFSPKLRDIESKNNACICFICIL